MKWLHNIGTGHTVDKFSVGRHKIVGKDHFEHWCFQMEQQTHAPLFGCVVKNKMCIQPLFKAPKKGKTVLQSIRRQLARALPHQGSNERATITSGFTIFSTPATRVTQEQSFSLNLSHSKSQSWQHACSCAAFLHNFCIHTCLRLPCPHSPRQSLSLSLCSSEVDAV